MASKWPASLPTPFGPYRATIVEVHDGDTLTADASLGFDCYARVTVRLFGVNTPELTKGTAAQRKAGRAARDFVKQLLPPGSPVRVTTLIATSGEQTRSFVRYVASIEMPGPVASDLASVLVAAGHAGFCDRDLKPLGGPPPAIERWIQR